MKRQKDRKRLILLCVVVLLCSCGGKETQSFTSDTENEEAQWEKGYDLPVDEGERAEAEADCKMVMDLILDIYEQSEKGETENVILSDEAIQRMRDRIEETGSPVYTTVIYSDMKNHEKMETFLSECMEGEKGSIVAYEIGPNGGIGRMKYHFDGQDMYLLSTKAVWNKENHPVITSVSFDRIKDWRLSEKGWFGYQLCVPEYPEVTEVVDGSCLIRVEPMNERYREMSEKYVRGLRYQGNNLLCSNWDADHMEDLDYNGVYEYLYEMKYQETFPSEEYSEGIPAEMFESLIMEYLPVTKEQIRAYAVFDEVSQTYKWARLGAFNRSLTFFGVSVPEVVGAEENEDGTVTLTVDAVCDMVLCDDAVITHELTVRPFEDGSFQYLGNKILGDEDLDIPTYRYRISEE